MKVHDAASAPTLVARIARHRTPLGNQNGASISAIGLAARRRAVLLLDPATQRADIEQPYDIVAMMLMFTAFLVGVFYCLDALHGERRDRSILFWKSLPVSDFTTVLSKAII